MFRRTISPSSVPTAALEPHFDQATKLFLKLKFEARFIRFISVI